MTRTRTVMRSSAAMPTFGTARAPSAGSAPRALRVLGLKDLPTMKGICFHPNHLRRLIAKGDFPKPTYLSERCPVWDEVVIDAWLKAKIAASA
jgi:predicted DNA-binding transcriptional regulator AlpA